MCSNCERHHISQLLSTQLDPLVSTYDEEPKPLSELYAAYGEQKFIAVYDAEIDLVGFVLADSAEAVVKALNWAAMESSGGKP